MNYATRHWLQKRKAHDIFVTGEMLTIVPERRRGGNPNNIKRVGTAWLVPADKRRAI
jgi:hypothetical protein